jgi:hypothetical protein
MFVIRYRTVPPYKILNLITIDCSANRQRGCIHQKKKMAADQSDDHLFSFSTMTLTY